MKSKYCKLPLISVSFTCRIKLENNGTVCSLFILAKTSSYYLDIFLFLRNWDPPPPKVPPSQNWETLGAPRRTRVIRGHQICCSLFLKKFVLSPCKAELPQRGMELKEKKHKKYYRPQKIYLERTYSQKMSVSSGLKATKIIGQRKKFYRQRIPEFSCARKKTVDIDVFVTSRNVDRKIMQSIRITSRPPSSKRKWNQLSHF